MTEEKEKPDYGRLGNWAIEEFRLEHDIFELEESKESLSYE